MSNVRVPYNYTRYAVRAYVYGPEDDNDPQCLVDYLKEGDFEDVADAYVDKERTVVIEIYAMAPDSAQETAEYLLECAEGIKATVRSVAREPVPLTEDELEERAAQQADWDAIDKLFAEVQPHDMVDIADNGNGERTLVVCERKGDTLVLHTHASVSSAGLQTIWIGDPIYIKRLEIDGIARCATHCQHGLDLRRPHFHCQPCDDAHREASKNIKYILNGLHSRVVL